MRQILQQAVPLAHHLQQARRDEKSFLWLLRCSGKLRYPLGQQGAIWTSGEPLRPFRASGSISMTVFFFFNGNHGGISLRKMIQASASRDTAAGTSLNGIFLTRDYTSRPEKRKMRRFPPRPEAKFTHRPPPTPKTQPCVNAHQKCKSPVSDRGHRHPHSLQPYFASACRR